MGMCKICGRIVAKGESKKIPVGGMVRDLCESCVDKTVPAMAAPYVPG